MMSYIVLMLSNTSNVFVITLLLTAAVQIQTSTNCSNSPPFVNFTDQQKIFLSAARLNTSQQQAQVIALYQSLSQIDTYNISMKSPFPIYSNNMPTCLKNISTIRTYNAKKDNIWLCFDQYYLLTCNEIWELVIKCGTFIEVHRPFDPEVIVWLNLEIAAQIKDSAGENITNMVIRSLCAGTYHLWFVYYSRMGKFIKGVKTIYINYPSCSC